MILVVVMCKYEVYILEDCSISYLGKNRLGIYIPSKYLDKIKHLHGKKVIVHVYALAEKR